MQGKNGSFDADSDVLAPGGARREPLRRRRPTSTGGAPTVAAGNFKTLVLVDRGRLPLPSTPPNPLNTKLNTFIARSEVDGTIVNVGADTTVAALNAQADAKPSCPFAKNLVAARIKRIVDAHRDAYSELQYVVVVGGDGVIPFFRYPDPALLGNETLYTPPVRDDTPSQASLRLGYVLTDDFIASSESVSLHGNLFPVPDLADRTPRRDARGHRGDARRLSRDDRRRRPDADVVAHDRLRLPHGHGGRGRGAPASGDRRLEQRAG